MVSLGYRVKQVSRDGLFQFLTRAIPFYERPGGIQVSLYESLDTPGQFLELVAYKNSATYDEDQERVENSPEYLAVLKEWRSFVDGDVDVGRLERVDLKPYFKAESTDIASASENGFLVEPSVFNDYLEIARLLTGSDLPVPDSNDKPVLFLVARNSHGDIVACLGWESYGHRALLRSLAVRDDHKGQGIGSSIVRAALVRLEQAGCSEFYLLTSSASDFAMRFGFEPIERSALPEAVATSCQVSSTCCAKAQCMRLQIHQTAGVNYSAGE
jgi:amino-acid N-acetyltransferase